MAQALEQGYNVTAFTRCPEKIGQPHEKLQVVEGGILDPASVERAINGRDAVLCTLEMALMNKEKLRATGTSNSNLP